MVDPENLSTSFILALAEHSYRNLISSAEVFQFDAAAKHLDDWVKWTYLYKERKSRQTHREYTRITLPPPHASPWKFLDKSGVKDAFIKFLGFSPHALHRVSRAGLAILRRARAVANGEPKCHFCLLPHFPRLCSCSWPSHAAAFCAWRT